MEEEIFDRRALLELARSQHLISLGSILTPEEVERVVKVSGTRQPGIKGWVLFGQMHPEMYELGKAEGVLAQFVSVVKSDRGLHYLVIAQQIADWQHRFLIPLVGGTLKRFIAEVKADTFHLSLSAPGQRASQVVESSLNSCSSLLDVAGMSDDDEVLDLSDDTREMAYRLLQSDAVVIRYLTPAHFACVTVGIATERKKTIEEGAMRMELTGGPESS
ncbi:MAG: hypothetical protein Q7T10_16250 [Rhodoferax sp.]|uniref:hypothetical protein n=1 Tax=Rhodoferax sp. TaxID=50421 RepID=UPI002717821F|nr:hypothetical protein [Rhodoferax sp.]MDO8450351.1 hypothetical protein [Rhodoferax sp.]